MRKKNCKAFFLLLLIVTYQDITQPFWIKVVNHMMKVMPLLFFLCNKHED